MAQGERAALHTAINMGGPVVWGVVPVALAAKAAYIYYHHGDVFDIGGKAEHTANAVGHGARAAAGAAGKVAHVATAPLRLVKYAVFGSKEEPPSESELALMAKYDKIVAEQNPGYSEKERKPVVAYYN